MTKEAKIKALELSIAMMDSQAIGGKFAIANVLLKDADFADLLEAELQDKHIKEAIASFVKNRIHADDFKKCCYNIDSFRQALQNILTKEKDAD